MTDSLLTRRAQVRSSMLWAAWGDAVGFITELATESLVSTRLRGARSVTEAVRWRRRIGGKFNYVDADLPAGCYSDDTQLRLSTSRAITSRGFDVDVFSKVELTVWPTYALGGGRASKAAAGNLAKTRAPWYGNFYRGWTLSGGNGAAMRAQPHAWAARHPAAFGDHVHDVVRNAVVSHGHPRAILGAAVHAIALGFSIESQSVPNVQDWRLILTEASRALEFILTDAQIAAIWIARWQNETGTDFRDAWAKATGEFESEFSVVANLLGSPNRVLQRPSETYKRVIAELGLLSPSDRGSGVKTVVASLALASLSAEDPKACGLIAANVIGSDTDTIGSMACALVGAATATDFTETVLDVEYLSGEADRLTALAFGRTSANLDFRYPDLMGWTPPKTQIDGVGTSQGALALAGLALLKPVSAPAAIERDGAEWQWMSSSIGASFFTKRRAEPHELPDGQRPERSNSPADVHAALEPIWHAVGVGAGRSEGPNASERHLRSVDGGSRVVDISAIFSWVKQRGYRDADVGYAIRRIAEDGTYDQLIALAAALKSSLEAH